MSPLRWAPLPQHLIDRELLAQSDMVERGKRLRAYAERRAAVTLDGQTCEPLSDVFPSARRLDAE